MKLIADKLTIVISSENKKASDKIKRGEFEQLLNEMKKTGLIKIPNYNLPLVDTLGKTYYSSESKRK